MGCGSGTEPFNLLGDSSQALGAPTGQTGGQLNLPLASTTLSGAQASSFTFVPFSSSASRPYFTLRSAYFFGTSSNLIVAAGSGVVVDTLNNSVTLMHNAHVVSKVMNAQATLPVGSYVAQGATIGTTYSQSYYASPEIRFYVFADGIPVCPSSFLSQTARTQMQNALAMTTNYMATYGLDACGS
jgi:hypothetical protein